MFLKDDLNPKEILLGIYVIYGWNYTLSKVDPLDGRLHRLLSASSDVQYLQYKNYSLIFQCFKKTFPVNIADRYLLLIDYNLVPFDFSDVAQRHDKRFMHTEKLIAGQQFQNLVHA